MDKSTRNGRIKWLIQIVFVAGVLAATIRFNALAISKQESRISILEHNNATLMGKMESIAADVQIIKRLLLK